VVPLGHRIQLSKIAWGDRRESNDHQTVLN